MKKRTQKRTSRGLFQNPLFYFGLSTFILFGFIYIACDSHASIGGLNDSRYVFFNNFFNQPNNLVVNNLFSNQSDAGPLETPDLKIIQENTLYGVSTPRVVSGKVLGDVFGSSNQNKKDIIEYVVQAGDTLNSIANTHKISVNTLLWANDLTASSRIKIGQSLVILPVDGVLHVTKEGETLSTIASKYKAVSGDVVAFNNLINQDDIYIGDILVVPGGILPKKSAPILNNNQAPLANNFFIFPVEGKISQGLHYYNAIDVANKCGTPVYAAAAGVVQRARYGWNFGGGNNVTILHSNGVVTYYGHLQTILVKPGDKVYVGQNIGLVGGQPGTPGAGISTGCHLHFQVVGAKNPLSNYSLGANISYK